MIEPGGCQSEELHFLAVEEDAAVRFADNYMAWYYPGWILKDGLYDPVWAQECNFVSAVAVDAAGYDVL